MMLFLFIYFTVYNYTFLFTWKSFAKSSAIWRMLLKNVVNDKLIDANQT